MVSEIGRPHDRAVHDFLLDREVPILHARILDVRIEEVGTEASRQRSRVVDVDDVVAGVHAGDVLRRASQSVVRQTVGRYGGIRNAVDETGGHQLRGALAVEPVGNRLGVIGDAITAADHK